MTRMDRATELYESLIWVALMLMIVFGLAEVI